MLYTDALLSPTAAVYESAGVRDALEYLQAFVEAATRVDWRVTLPTAS